MLNSGDTVRLGHTQLVFRIAGTVVIADPAEPVGYLDVTEEWTPQAAPGSPARPAAPTAQPGPPRPVADRPPAAVPILPYDELAAGQAAQAAAGNDPLGARRNGGFAQVRGIARNVQRQARNQTRVLLFRVERYDAAGNRLSPVGVEFHHYKSGQLSDGEEVEVIGSWKHGTLRAKKVSNLTTHAEVLGPSAAGKAFGRFFITVFFIIWGSIALFIIASLVASG